MKIKCFFGTILCVVIVGGLIWLTSGFPVEGERAAQLHLENLGYTPVYEEQAEYKVPKEPDAVYYTYNELQKEAGYDLDTYAGETLQRYSFKLNDYGDNNVYANVLVIKRTVVGGDVSQRALDGHMYPLLPKHKIKF